jgi:hypothetical protein
MAALSSFFCEIYRHMAGLYNVLLLFFNQNWAQRVILSYAILINVELLFQKGVN